jgi:glycosyltransferase involved in cell wall biosynthesis
MDPTVAIIIPALNSPIIDQVLDRVISQEGIEKVDEIIVVGKDEDSLLPDHALITFIDTGAPVKPPKARNMGIAATTAQLILFLDSDCLVEPSWLLGHLAAHKEGYGVVGGGVAPTGSGYWGLTYNLTLFHEFFATAPAGPRDYLPTLNLSVERPAIEAAGLMNEDLARGQDIEWTVRMAKSGSTLYFDPSAMVVHSHTRTGLGDVWRDCARSGYYMRQVRLHNPDRLKAPTWLRHRWTVLLLSPLIAAGVTLRMLARRPATIVRNWHTLPGLYLTKIAWCWGASRKSM